MSTYLKSGEPKASTSSVYDSSQEAFPKSLLYKVDENGKLTDQETEPLAGDARSYWGREMALMKMIAGILRVDFADLWVREKKEALKRKVIKGFILALIVALGIYYGTNSMGNQTNTELEQLKENKISIEYKLRHETLSQEQRVKFYDILDQLKTSIKNKKSTLAWLGKNKTEFLEHIAKIYNTKGVDQAIAQLEKNEPNREKKNIDNSKELIALAKLYIEKNQYKKANQT